MEFHAERGISKSWYVVVKSRYVLSSVPCNSQCDLRADQLEFLDRDVITGMPFRSGWALGASIFWALVFEGAHRYFKKRKSGPKTLS